MKKYSIRNIVARIREIPLLHNAVWIVAILLVMAIVAQIAMQIGTRHGSRRTVPELTGILLTDAEQIAAEHDLELIINDSLFVPAYEGGIVLAQLPATGVEVKPGRKVYITINSFSEKMVPLPYVAGRSLRQAKNMLEIAGLEIKELVYQPDMATNYVLAQTYKDSEITSKSRIMAEAGSGVTLIVGLAEGEDISYVPQVVGQSERDAKSRLWENGFNIGEVHYDKGINLLNRKDALVYKQSPALGTAQHLGTKVSLWLTLDEELSTKNREEADKKAQKLAAERQKQEAMVADSLARIATESTGEGSTADTDEEPSTDEFFE